MAEPTARAPRLHRWMLLPAAALGFLVMGGVLRLYPPTAGASRPVLFLGLVLTGAPLVAGTLRGVLQGRLAADVVAALAIVTAVVLVEPFAGLIIVLMQSGGEALERYAEGRASQAVRELEAAAPRIAHRLHGAALEDIGVDEIAVGDLLLVRPGEMIPADAVVVEGRSHVDTSRMTGEPIPVRARAGTRLPSGSLNQEGALTIRALALSRESQYARIVELVRTAQAGKAPLQRQADRAAVWFTPFTLAACAVAYLLSGDATRVLAVLVVATPCPLILAAPVAIIGGINRAARGHIIVRRGAAMEALARVNVAVFDKTGTLTVGIPEVTHILTADDWTEAAVLRLAAAVEQRSGHLVGRAVVRAAREAGQPILVATDIEEAAGRGVSGHVDGRRVAIGSLGYIRELHDDAAADLEPLEPHAAGLRAYVAVDGRGAAIITFADRIRPGLADLFRELDRLGIRRKIILSGDHEHNTRAVADALGIDEFRGDLRPEDKVAAVENLVRQGERVVMLGDGINDAPALGAATVGIALAGHGGGISAEAADVVILGDDPAAVADAIRISRKALRIARQSIGVGLGLSGAAMLVAALGHIQPAVGALLQEAIDVAVILNALRAAR
ncbi:MAG: heavy metal translocating P-type ATPase [Gemmatimonadetes bacterium]|nr:heavy metal translocating P-type ATPase [Gemmatimonadota bacterium]